MEQVEQPEQQQPAQMDEYRQLMERKVACPMCYKQFTLLEIEAHADECQGRDIADEKEQERQYEQPNVERSVLLRQDQLDISTGDIDDIIHQVESLGAGFSMDQQQLLKLLSSLSNQYDKIKEGEEVDDDWLLL